MIHFDHERRPLIGSRLRIASCILVLVSSASLCGIPFGYKCEGRQHTLTRSVRGESGEPALYLLSRPRAIGAGGVVRFAVVNLRARSVSFGEEFEVQVHGANGWGTASFSPKGPWLDPIFSVSRGGRGSFERFRIPETAESGTYRIVKPVRSGGKDLALSAEFKVFRSHSNPGLPSEGH